MDYRGYKEKGSLTSLYFKEISSDLPPIAGSGEQANPVWYVIIDVTADGKIDNLEFYHSNQKPSNFSGYTSS